MTTSGRPSRTVSRSDSPGFASSTSMRSPTATRATARVFASTPASSTRGRRAASKWPLTAPMFVATEDGSPAAGTRRPPIDVGMSASSPAAGTGRGVMVSASGPAASITARAADIRSAQVWKRRSGDFSSALAITASRPPGSSGRADVSRGGSSERCA